MRFDLITIFPEIFDSYISESILGRAQRKRLVKVVTHNLRRFSADTKHHKVDDRPYGGGVGMVMQVQPFYKAVQHVRQLKAGRGRRRVILTSAKGKLLTQTDLKRWTSYDQLVILCGRYEGVDERVMKFVDEEVSIGPYVLTGGELAAAVIVDGVTRLLPGVLGKDNSSVEESHSQMGVLEHPQYTRPETFFPKRGVQWTIPTVLKTGNHKRIQEWRKTTASTVAKH